MRASLSNFRAFTFLCKRRIVPPLPSQTILRSSSTTTTTTTDNVPPVVTREDLAEEAASMTKSLYRNCLRSVKIIRQGSTFDDMEFDKREEEFLKPSGGGLLSMAPPPDREDELHSRAEYYHSFAREYFTQESDCLENDPLREKDIRRYLFYLRKGEKDRKWLLADMMFPDPYSDSMDHERIDNFEALSKKYLGEDEDESQESDSEEESGNDDFFDDADDQDPEWFQKKYPNLK